LPFQPGPLPGTDAAADEPFECGMTRRCFGPTVEHAATSAGGLCRYRSGIWPVVLLRLGGRVAGKAVGALLIAGPLVLAAGILALFLAVRSDSRSTVFGLGFVAGLVGATATSLISLPSWQRPMFVALMIVSVAGLWFAEPFMQIVQKRGVG
jgi:hypothetical protein